MEAFVELRFAGSARVDAIAEVGADIADVVEVFTIAGEPDALVRIQVRDVDQLKRVVDELRGKSKVTSTKTLMVLGRSGLYDSPISQAAARFLTGLPADPPRQDGGKA
jgi:Lrp/AsnC family transcriptional regulator, leucine-responsive regulatory protein